MLAPEWDRARALLAEGRRAACELGAEILRLRELYLHRGHGGDRRGDRRSSGTFVQLEKKGGFVAELEAQLGMHHETARRLLLDLEREREIRAIAEGAVEVIVEGEVERVVTPEVQAAAQRIVRELDQDPRARPARKWAGLWGAAATAGRERAPTNHARNLERGIKALAMSLEHWADLSPEERATVEHYWSCLAQSGLIPETWKRV